MTNDDVEKLRTWWAMVRKVLVTEGHALCRFGDEDSSSHYDPALKTLAENGLVPSFGTFEAIEKIVGRTRGETLPDAVKRSLVEARNTIEMEFVVWAKRDQEEPVSLRVVRAPEIPSVGAIVVLYGAEFGDPDRVGYGEDESCCFVVDSVFWEPDRGNVMTPKVLLREEIPRQGMALKCVCAPQDRKPKEDDPRTCEECGDTIPIYPR